MTPQELKNSILQLAMQGKLVEQRPEEGTAEELFAQIQAEKQRLIKEGRIKKEKPLPEITEAEKPFDIPESWMWCRFGNIVNIVSARRVHKADWRTDGIPFYRAREIAKLADYGFVDNELFISEKLYDEFSKSGIPHPGDLMVTAVGTLGKCYIVKEGDKFYYKDASVICLENYARLLPDYLKLIMQSEMLLRQIRSNSSGTTVATLTIVRMNQYLLPLPPLAEQERIVAKLEELLPLVDQYGDAAARLADYEARFPDDLRKSLLQEAITGRLVPQRPEDGTADALYEEIQQEKVRLIAEKKIKKEKPLPPIAEEEKPFDIPDTWKWVRLGDLLRVISGVSYKKNDVTSTGVRVLRGGNIQNGEIHFADDDVFLPSQYYDEEMIIHQGDIAIVASTGSKKVIGKSGFAKNDMPDTMIGAFLRICRPYLPKMALYIRCIFGTPYYRKHIRDLSQGTNINNIKTAYITELAVPLPPLAEQDRIVAKLEELLPLTERIHSAR